MLPTATQLHATMHATSATKLSSVGEHAAAAKDGGSGTRGAAHGAARAATVGPHALPVRLAARVTVTAAAAHPTATAITTARAKAG